MKYAEVAVSSPLAQRKTFSYAIPDGMPLLPGQPVWVPFGQYLKQGIALELTDSLSAPPTENIKEIAAVIQDCTPLSAEQIKLSRWISDYYLAPLFESLALMLPPGFQQHPVTFIRINPNALPLSNPTLDQKYVLENLKQKSNIQIRDIERHLGKSKSTAVLIQLQKKGVINKIQLPRLSSMKLRSGDHFIHQQRSSRSPAAS